MKNLENKTDLSLETGTTALYFSAAWCGPCRMLAPVMERVSEKFPSVGIFKVDVDSHKEIATEWGVRGIPTVIFIKEGKEIGKFSGMKSESDISSLMENLSA
jgi:thioredoxin 1